MKPDARLTTFYINAVFNSKDYKQLNKSILCAAKPDVLSIAGHQSVMEAARMKARYLEQAQ